ncbi:DeoR/GlpR family DNA-binding transcription regulator [Carboxydochorda subterranea]|uniref:DeoR/GlpR family DNA-binding transcription regulator n=1 Tax=Carboxydichorda subterranea TaxID=3109565 RepID=A0ABZ1BY33_9FIRM|nr:DeoR/GlpR family DNA-binding transcription regulator [Limnochorda sp. L945t]WRP17601.1 DeoR/GlpR family DNA-binding transcription regulator [Limnochorda sp. L945t]
MIKPERHDRILSEIARRGAASVAELAALLGVSEATIRRDLQELGESGLLRRTHGGASLADQSDELPYHFKVTAFLPEKRRIGAVAASMVQDGQVVGCTGGTTVAQFVRALRGRKVTVVTSAVNVAADLASSPETEVFVTGGALRGRSFEMVGHTAERAIREFRLDVAVVGVDGLSVEYGLTTYNPAEAHVNRTFIEQAKEVWVVADHSKLGKVTPAIIAPVERMHRLVTDSSAPHDFLARLQQLGIQTITA